MNGRTMRKPPLAFYTMTAAIALSAAAVPAAAATIPQYRQDVTAFVSAKGERALVMGYPDALEIWAYPLQLASDYRLKFRVGGTIEPIDAITLLRQVDRNATGVVRTYVGRDFVVRERLFVPRQEAGAILSYEVEGRADVQLEVSFRPSLNLMWPAALGGRSIGWDAARSGYVEREPLHAFSATISSPEAVAHDDIVNFVRPVADRLAMLLQPRAGPDGRRRADLVFALDTAPGVDGAGAVRQSVRASRIDAARHAEAVLDESTELVTPDAAINKALASATLALDGAWACNDRIGCGTLGGYGPSRPDRRPQYAWFFAGDGLVAMEGMLEAGQFDRARDELAFVTRYQDPKTGMIWHEMSQSAGLIDWVGHYPYMYVHVDITFQYLAAVRRYVATTGDVAFARTHWRSLQAAWRYCTSVIVGATGLPGIPPGKQGQNEQEDLRDDIRLSTLWVDAADGYADIAAALGKASLARQARTAATRARLAIASAGWDEETGFWLSGHRRDGTAVRSQRPDAISVLGQGAFDERRVERALDRIATPDFLTDWGARNLSARDPTYDPNMYGQGSVWGLGSAAVAETFWRQHRPLNGWAVWRGMAAGDTLDSAGHLHELLAGDLYHPEYESVPEQTWSSAGLLMAAMRGFAGLEVRAAERRVVFAPHLPAEWDGFTLRRVRVGQNRVTLTLRRDADGIEVTVDNPGAALTVEFDPMLPLGADIVGAAIDRVPAAATLSTHPQDRHASLRIVAKAGGKTSGRIAFAKGVDVAATGLPPAIGERSRNPVVARVEEIDGALRIDAWSPAGNTAEFTLRTDRVLGAVTGGSIRRDGPGRYRLTLAGGTPGAMLAGYERQSAIVRLAP